MSLTLNKILVLCALLISAMLPGWSWAESAWQDSSDTVGEFNGTVPTADSASIPVYQGSVFLDPTKTHEVAFTAKPSEFNADVSVSKLLVTNPQDREGDIIATPRWENQTPPAVSLVWADAATPDTYWTHSQSQIARFVHRDLPGVRWSPGRSLIPSRPCRCYIYSPRRAIPMKVF